jgi:hypothetical protein
LQVVQVPNRGIWGTAGIDGANIDTGIQNDGAYLQVGTASSAVNSKGVRHRRCTASL